MGCRLSKQRAIIVSPSLETEQGEEGKTESAALEGRKLVCLVLHGTTMDGEEMRNMYKWKECGIDPFCKDIAEFYYASGPCVVSKKHPIWKGVEKGRQQARGDKARHWWTMKNEWDFGEKNFADARASIAKFVEEEIKKPVDVIIGYSQGAQATTQILNEIFKDQTYGTKGFLGKATVRAAIFHGCPSHPSPNKNVGQSVLALHCNGDKDPFTGLENAKQHSAKFGKNATFFKFNGGHEVMKVQQEPIRKFLLRVKEGAETK